jgi:hypothetical protein
VRTILGILRFGAPSNAERQDLNRRIREALIDAGRVERKSVKAPVVVRQGLTREQKGRASSYGVGDTLRFVRGGGGAERAVLGFEQRVRFASRRARPRRSIAPCLLFAHHLDPI